LMAPIVVWAGRGLTRLSAWARETAKGLGLLELPSLAIQAVVLVSSIGLVILASEHGVRRSDEMSQSWQPAFRDDAVVGRWLRSQEREPRIADTSPTIAYYAGAVLIRLPWTDSSTAVRYIERLKPSFVILHESQRNTRPYLAEWFVRPPDERLILVKAFEGSAGMTRVYRWRDSRT
jgi:hypothetical protein